MGMNNFLLFNRSKKSSETNLAVTCWMTDVCCARSKDLSDYNYLQF